LTYTGPGNKNWAGMETAKGLRIRTNTCLCGGLIDEVYPELNSCRSWGIISEIFLKSALSLNNGRKVTIYKKKMEINLLNSYVHKFID
jgi:hypothetical protein